MLQMRMSRNQASSDQQTSDEDYIDMEVSSSSSNYFYSKITSSPPETREFEFHHEKHSTTSPADELFYKGTLLPLHLPPRLQMVQTILQTSNTTKLDTIDQRLDLSFIKASKTAPNINTSTPLDRSCNISPSESCRVSTELNPDDYVSNWSEEMSAYIGGDDDPSKKTTWSKKLKLIKQTLLSQRLKSSRAYVKSLFSKSTSLDANLACNAESENGVSKSNKECLNKYMKMAKKNPFGKINNARYQISKTATLMKSIEKEMAEENANTTTHRKSFSGAFQQHSMSSSSTTSSVSSSSSSSFSFSSNGLSDSQLLKRSVSANSEIESSIEGAIAHCKQSYQNVGVKTQFVGVKTDATSKAMRDSHIIAL